MNVREIGHNINVMSDKLERTIEQLRANNNELERKSWRKLSWWNEKTIHLPDVSQELKTIT